jgi:hypothetical protein
MNAFLTRIGKAVVVLGVSGLVIPRSAWAIGPAAHGSVGSSSYFHAPSQTVQPSSSHAYTHSTSSGNSTAKSAISSSSALRTIHNTTNVTGGSTTPKASKVSGTSSSQTTIMSSNGTVGSTNAGGNLVFKRNVKNPTGATATLPAGGGSVKLPSNPASKQVMDDESSLGQYWDEFWSGGGPLGDLAGLSGYQLGNSPLPNTGDGQAMPEPSKPQPTKIWSGSTNLASSANVNAKGTIEKASVALKKGEQVQKHLDQVATANSPAGKLKKGEQIQKQISAGASNPTTPVPNPPSPPNPGPTTPPATTPTPVVVPFPVSAGMGWGYFGGGFGGFAGDAGIGSDDAGAIAASDAPMATAAAATDPAPAPTTPDASQPADSELTLKLGESYTIANENFGTKAGKLSLQLNGLALAVHVDQWDADQISFTLPVAGLTKTTEAKFQIKSADQQLLKAVTVMVSSADAAQ